MATGHPPFLGLPVWQTAKDAYVFVYGNRASVAAVAAVPFTVSLAITFLLTPERIGGWAMVVALVSLLMFCVFAVAWHRFVLLGRRDTNFPIQFIAKHREVKYGYYLVIIFLLGMAVGLVVQVAWIGLSPSNPMAHFAALIAGPIAGALIAVRLAMLLPAIAIGAPTGIRAAWRQLHGSGWRLFIALVLVSIPPVVVSFVIEGLIAETITGVVVVQAISWLHSALLVTVISLAYRYLVMDGPASAAGSSRATPD